MRISDINDLDCVFYAWVKAQLLLWWCVRYPRLPTSGGSPPAGGIGFVGFLPPRVYTSMFSRSWFEVYCLRLSISGGLSSIGTIEFFFSLRLLVSFQFCRSSVATERNNKLCRTFLERLLALRCVHCGFSPALHLPTRFGSVNLLVQQEACVEESARFFSSL